MMRRNGKYVLQHVGGNSYNVMDRVGNTVMDSDSDFFIYFKDVKFEGNLLIGTYLGEATGSLIDGYCVNVECDGNGFWNGLEKFDSARMVAVDNKTKTVIIIA